MRQRAALPCRSPPRLSRWRFCRLPLVAGLGLLPSSAAKDFSECSRCGLSPATTSSVLAVSGPTPCLATRSGATAVVMRRSRRVVSASCSSSTAMRWASSRSTSRVVPVRLSSSLRMQKLRQTYSSSTVLRSRSRSRSSSGAVSMIAAAEPGELPSGLRIPYRATRRCRRFPESGRAGGRRRFNIPAVPASSPDRSGRR